jgi:hypothetical protein
LPFAGKLCEKYGEVLTLSRTDGSMPGYYAGISGKIISVIKHRRIYTERA